MANFEQWINQDLQDPVQAVYSQSLAFSSDNDSILVGVHVTDGGEPATLSGSVVAHVIRSADGGTVSFGGTLSGSDVSAVLPAACFAYPGQIAVMLQLVSGTTKTTLCKALYSVVQGETGTPIDPGGVVPDLDDLLAMLDEMAQATDAAESAAAAVPAIIAPTFSPSTPYTAGRYVYYNGALYRFTDDHAAGAWVGTDAVSVQLTPEVADLKSALDEAYYSKTFSGNANQSQVIYYPLVVGQKYSISNKGNSAVNWRTRETEYGESLYTYGLGAGKTITISAPVASNYIGVYSAGAYELEFVDLGTKLGTLEREQAVIKTELAYSALNENASDKWESGGISYVNGNTAATTARIRTKELIPSNVTICLPDAGYAIEAAAYDGNTFIGIFTGTDFKKEHSWLKIADLREMRRLHPSYEYRIVVKRNDEKDISTNEWENISLLSPVIPERAINVEGIALADFSPGIIVGNTVGQTINFTPDVRSATNWAHLLRKCYAGDKFVVTAQGGDRGRAWMFTDTKGTILKRSDVGSFTDAEVFADYDGYFICNSTYEISFAVKYSGNISCDEIITKIQSASEALDNLENYMPFVPETPPDNAPVVSSVQYNQSTKMTLSEIYDGYDSLAENYPGYATKETLGKDQSGTYDIFRYDFTPSIPLISQIIPASDGKKYSASDLPTVILSACIHGNEHPCARALLNFMDKVCKAEAENNVFGWLRRNFHFVVIPVANPWGYENQTRWNSNHVDLNRNFPIYWDNGPSDQTDSRYRGSAPGSEAETQYYMGIIDEYSDEAILSYDYHTFGMHDSYLHMTDYEIFFCKINALQQIGVSLISDITRSGWNNHDLPRDSGYIGFIQPYSGERVGMVGNYGASKNIPSATPECMYHYYDGTTTADYSTKVNCMNTEYIMYSVFNALKRLLEFGW